MGRKRGRNEFERDNSCANRNNNNNNDHVKHDQNKSKEEKK